MKKSNFGLADMLNHVYSLFPKEQIEEFLNNDELRKETIVKLKEQYEFLRGLDIMLCAKYEKVT